MNLVHTALKPFLIQEYSNELRHLVVERTIANKQIRIISGYGPQENWAEAERMPFFHSIRTGNYKSWVSWKISCYFIELDANSKLGPDVITGDMYKQSENGKV